MFEKRKIGCKKRGKNSLALKTIFESQNRRVSCKSNWLASDLAPWIHQTASNSIILHPNRQKKFSKVSRII